jgi:hypothetical protein
VSVLRFEIRYPDGRKEVMAVEAERVLIGHGAHCDIRLPLDQAASEHVAMEVVGSTVRVEAKAFQPPPTLNGMPFTNGVIGPDIPLTIGPIRIFVSLGESGSEGPTVQKRDKEETSPLMKVLGVFVLVAGAYMVLGGDDAAAPGPPARAPELFSSTAVTCPQTTSDEALAFAADKFDIAEGKRERSPFAAQDGLQAVELYQLASACFRRGGDAARAAEADADAAQLRASILQDFRSREIRLEHLMAVEDYTAARSDVAVLRAYTRGRQGDWVAWLEGANQTIKQKVPRK